LITRVRLKNWKSHEKTELRLGDGTNVLVGIMGSGKSAVLDAITFALFGTVPAVQNRTIKLEDLIRSRPRRADSAEVEVAFSAPDESEYVVKRVVERGKGTTLSELRGAGGELIESPHSTRVSESISSLLKLDYALFERAVYAEQNRLDYFLTIRRGERMRKMDELLGINKLELARKNMTTLINRVQGRLRDREEIIGELERDDAIASLPSLELDLKDLEASREGVQKQLEDARPKIEATKARLGQLQRIREQVVRLDKSSGELEGAIRALEEQANQIKSKLGEVARIDPTDLKLQIAELQETYEKNNQNFDSLNSELSAQNSKISGLKTEVRIAQEHLNEVSSELKRARELKEEFEELGLPEVTKRLEELQKTREDVETKLATARAKIEELQQIVKELEAAESTCPVCEAPLTGGKKQELLLQRREQLERYRRDVSKLQDRAAGLARDLRDTRELHKRGELLKGEVKAIEKMVSERARTEKRLREAKLELEKSQKEAQKTRSEVESLRKRIDETREKFTGARRNLDLRADLNRVENERGQKQARHLRVQRDLQKLQKKYDEQKVRELEESYDNLIRTQERLKAEFSGKGELIAEKRKILEAARKKGATLQRYRVEGKYLGQAIEGLQKIQTALARCQTSLRQHFIEAVNSTMSELWRDIYPYGDYTDIRLWVEGGEPIGDYVLQLRDRTGNWIPVEGVTSGGEQTCACLTLRIAFAVVLAPALSWLVLDEPTHNLDTQGIRELAVVLRERIPEIVRQLLLITHEERLEAAVSGYLYRFYRDKNRDEPTRVTQVATVGE